MVCSIDESALRRVADAIEQLDADRKSADPAALEARIAAVWAMVREIDRSWPGSHPSTRTLPASTLQHSARTPAGLVRHQPR